MRKLNDVMPGRLERSRSGAQLGYLGGPLQEVHVHLGVG